ncbi:MAG: hypothetical protein GF313_07340 [Caldithrix sp.]|nr:hypothetical protein [Caldithrix sp.]
MSQKELCKIAKKDYLDSNLNDYRVLVQNPRYLCKKCGRAANAKELLCKSKKLYKKKPSKK